MSTTDTNQSNIERAETIADWTQKTVNVVAKYYGGPVGQAFSNFLTGQAGLTTSMGGLIDKINKGTATGDDVADALQDMASIVAGFGVMAGYANPWMFGVLFGVGLLRGAVDYLEAHPELGSDLLDVLKQPMNINGWLDIWHDMDREYNIDHTVNDLYHAFKNWTPPRRDPLVLDLDGDGIETLGITSTTQVLFDYDGDGVKTGTGWIKEDDGFVVLDRNGNGTIDNGGELFGDQTLVGGAKASDGFAALSAEDTNQNGKFDAGDTNFTKVRIWQDTNSDGISQAGELHTLNELGITSINLTSTTSNIVSNGNVQIAAGTYTKTNGTTGESGTLNLTEDTGNAGNLNFSQNPFYSEFTDHLTLTDTALALPDMQGSGMVRDLREASTLSAGLTSTLQSMSTTYETHDQMMAQVDTLLSEWAGTSSMATSVQQEEAINGNKLIYLPTQSSSDFDLYFKILHNTATVSTADIEHYNYLLSEQVRITAMISVLERFNGENFVTITSNSIVASGSGTVISTRSDTSTNDGSGLLQVIDPRVFVGLSAAQVSFLDQSYTALKQSVYDGLVLQTRLSSYMDAINLTIDGTGIHINDSVMMGMLTTLLQTNPDNAFVDLFEIKKYASANLSVLGWNGDVRISDMLAASDGIYNASAIFAKYGMSIADGLYTGTTGNDDVWGKQRDDVINAGDGNNTVHSGAGNDSITTGNGVNTIHGGDGNDTITTGYGADSLYGDAGDDIINSGDGNDTVFGGGGNDSLYGGLNGADTLSGGEGNDILEGGMGNDTYVFNRGDGQDIIYDGYNRRGSTYIASDNGTDTISFGAGIGKTDITFYFNGTSLCIGYGSADAITIENQSNINNAIEKFALADGNFLTSNDLNVIIQSMNSYAMDHGMSITSLDTVKANQDLMNIVAGAWHQ